MLEKIARDVVAEQLRSTIAERFDGGNLRDAVERTRVSHAPGKIVAHFSTTIGRHERAQRSSTGVTGARTTVDAETAFVVTFTLILADTSRSTAFYYDVLGATVLYEGKPTLVRFGNLSITISQRLPAKAGSLPVEPC